MITIDKYRVEEWRERLARLAIRDDKYYEPFCLRFTIDYLGYIIRIDHDRRLRHDKFLDYRGFPVDVELV